MPPINLPATQRNTLLHSLRTAVAALLSLLAAQLVRMPEIYWAAITTMIVMQSNLGAAILISGQRLVGTALGAATGAVLARFFGPNIYAFGAGAFLVGAICVLVRLDRVAYRYAGITLAVVMLIVHPESVWLVAMHRFTEVSVGIVVGLAVTAAWPEKSSG
jgi:uncharacterized membrane protein YccC